MVIYGDNAIFYFLNKSVIGFRKSDGLKICAKQVPKSRIVNWEEHKGRRIPREFKMHFLANEIKGVVQVQCLIIQKTHLKHSI